MMTVLVLVRASLIDELYFMNGSFMFLSESGVSCVKAILGALQRQKIWSVQPDLLCFQHPCARSKKNPFLKKTRPVAR